MAETDMRSPAILCPFCVVQANCNPVAVVVAWWIVMLSEGAPTTLL